MSEEKTLPELSKEAQGILDSVKKLTVMDLANLVKHLEKEFGVSAAAPVAVAAAPAGGAGGDAPAEKTEFAVEITSAGDGKINVIKVVRELTGLGLKEAKDIVDAAPKVVKEKVSKADAEDMKKKLEEVGAKVTLK